MTIVTTGPATPTDALADVGRALVVGLGRSGRAAAEALRSHGVGVTLGDDRPDHPAVPELRAEGHDVVAGGDLRTLLDTADLVVPSPGVPEHAPVLAEAAARGLPVWSEPELGWRLRPRPLVAVTGTNGKTSTTELLTAMVAESGRPAVACGNIGLPFTTATATAPDGALLVAELSSFQLRFAGTLRPAVGVLLNLAADHLDWHPDLAAYGAAKARLWEAQRAGDWAVANLDDAATVELRDRHARHGRAVFSGSRPVDGGVGRDGDVLVARLTTGHGRVDGEVVDVAALADDGAPAPYQVANTAAAACAAMLVGVDVATVGRAASRYRAGRHRHETVGRDGDGVVFVDDSKATNVHAAAASLRTAPSIVWIAGGRAKGTDLSPLAGALSTVHDAVLIGEAADDLARVCATAAVPARLAASIEEAVTMARRLARPGDTVLLAPACASFDQFRDYADRGDRFAAAVRALLADPGPREDPA